jgi:hypothetical protein
LGWNLSKLFMAVTTPQVSVLRGEPQTAALHFPTRQIEDLTEIVHYSQIVDR